MIDMHHKNGFGKKGKKVFSKWKSVLARARQSLEDETAQGIEGNSGCGTERN